MRARASANDLVLECACLGSLAPITIGNRTAELLYRRLPYGVRTIRLPWYVRLYVRLSVVLAVLFRLGVACGK